MGHAHGGEEEAGVRADGDVFDKVVGGEGVDVADGGVGGWCLGEG